MDMLQSSRCYSANQIHFEPADRGTAHEIKSRALELAAFLAPDSSAREDEATANLIEEIARTEKVLAEFTDEIPK